MVSNIKVTDDAISALKYNGLVLKVGEGLQDYLSCEFKFSNDKKRAWLGQPSLIKNMEKKFGHVQDVWSHKTPGTPQFLYVRLMVDSGNISTEKQRAYPSSVGISLYLVKHL